jgi:hypothetical protein
MLEPFKRLQIPAPLEDGFLVRKDTNQPKRIHAVEIQNWRSLFEVPRPNQGESSLNDLSSTDRFSFDPSFNCVPVDERETGAGVVDSDPCAAAGFRWK